MKAHLQVIEFKFKFLDIGTRHLKCKPVFIIVTSGQANISQRHLRRVDFSNFCTCGPFLNQDLPSSSLTNLTQHLTVPLDSTSVCFLDYKLNIKALDCILYPRTLLPRVFLLCGVRVDSVRLEIEQSCCFMEVVYIKWVIMPAPDS